MQQGVETLHKKVGLEQKGFTLQQMNNQMKEHGIRK
jgi:hypothetical protein